MKTLILILILISSCQFTTSIRKRNESLQKRLEAFIAILEEHYSYTFNSETKTTDDINKQQYKNSTLTDDPNDRINITLWNQLNDEEIKNMPKIKNYSDEAAAIHWLEWYFGISQRYGQIAVTVEWNYETNITAVNAKVLTEQSMIRSPFIRKTLPIIKEFNKYMQHSKNPDLRLIFGRLAKGTVTMNGDDLKESSKLSAQLQSIYGKTTVCELNDTKKCYTIEPYLERLMETEKDYDRLTWAWKGWHDNCGNKVRPVYLPFVDLMNKDIKENGYTDLSQKWIEEYEMGNSTEFESIIDQLLKDIMPLYEQLHAYVRGRLCSLYPNRFNCNGPIPAHLLGNMWAQQWHDRFDDLIPYPDAPLVDITQVLRQKNFTIHEMYTTAEDFFTSINLYPMTPKFWTRSMFERPPNRAVVCHAAAYDLQYHADFRVKICTEVNDDYFYTIHHEMGHVEYYMAYTDKQPYVYRDGANSAFHEAIGDTIGMYAVSPAHLIKLRFLDPTAINRHFEINYLLRLALQKIAFLPFAYVMDKYRFQLFRNQIDTEHELNSMWWALRIEHGGIMAAVPRSDAINFDPGAKYHIPSNVPYLRYFMAHILQFQFYRALCQIKGQTKQLHMCDIYGNKEVGDKFKEMLAMGSSKPWPEILKTLTGESKLESKAILDFFQPLHDWLKGENLARGYLVGWM